MCMCRVRPGIEMEQEMTAFQDYIEPALSGFLQVIHSPGLSQAFYQAQGGRTPSNGSSREK